MVGHTSGTLVVVHWSYAARRCLGHTVEEFHTVNCVYFAPDVLDDDDGLAAAVETATAASGASEDVLEGLEAKIAELVSLLPGAQADVAAKHEAQLAAEDALRLALPAMRRRKKRAGDWECGKERAGDLVWY